MRDKCRHDQDQRRKHEQNSVQIEVVDARRDRLGDRVQQPGRGHSFAKTQTPSREDDDRPQEVVEVFLVQDPRAKEQHHRDDGDHPHIPKDVLELMADTPQPDGGQRHNRDKVLHSRELVLDRSNRHNGRVPAGFERCQ